MKDNMVPRFVKEYANYKRKQIDKSCFLDDNKKTEAKQKIAVSTKALNKEMITVDECIRMITDAY